MSLVCADPRLPGANPMAYAVYVDDDDRPWLSW
jgi:streptogramin lyase